MTLNEWPWMLHEIWLAREKCRANDIPYNIIFFWNHVAPMQITMISFKCKISLFITCYWLNNAPEKLDVCMPMWIGPNNVQYLEEPYRKTLAIGTSEPEGNPPIPMGKHPEYEEFSPSPPITLNFDGNEINIIHCLLRDCNSSSKF